MKKQVTTILSKPKTTITATAVIALIVGIVLYRHIGVAPQVSIPLSSDTATTQASSGDTINLAFPKSGRVESVSVKVGDKVKSGQVLAKISAPDALGLVNQAKSALELAEAQYAALNLDYAKTKETQDTIVANAYQTLLKTTPTPVPKDDSTDNISKTYPLPTISGNYLLNKEGTITIKTYEAAGGLAFTASGLVEDTHIITSNPVPIGNSGLSILFAPNITSGLTWTITLPDINSASYAANKNAYDLAVANRDRTLSELAANLGNDNSNASVAHAQISAAQGAYDAALGAYQSNVITSPVSGTVSFVDENLKTGQSVTANKNVISIIAQ